MGKKLPPSLFKGGHPCNAEEPSRDLVKEQGGDSVATYDTESEEFWACNGVFLVFLVTSFVPD